MSYGGFPAAGEGGAAVLRPQRDGDDAFLAALFAANTAPMLAPPGLPQAVMDDLVAMQFRAQAAGYAAHFPEARRMVLQRGERPVGRVVVEREERDLYVVDIAILPAEQGRGLGAAAVADVQREALAAGLGVRALVMARNLPSRAMFRRRGFVETGRTVGPSLELRWSPPEAAGR